MIAGRIRFTYDCLGRAMYRPKSAVNRPKGGDLSPRMCGILCP